MKQYFPILNYELNDIYADSWDEDRSWRGEEERNRNLKIISYHSEESVATAEISHKVIWSNTAIIGLTLGLTYWEQLGMEEVLMKWPLGCHEAPQLHSMLETGGTCALLAQEPAETLRRPNDGQEKKKRGEEDTLRTSRQR